MKTAYHVILYQMRVAELDLKGRTNVYIPAQDDLGVSSATEGEKQGLVFYGIDGLYLRPHVQLSWSQLLCLYGSRACLLFQEEHKYYFTETFGHEPIADNEG